MHHLLRLLKKVMADSPSISPLPLEQLRTRQIKHLPAIPPRRDPFLPIRLLQPLLDTLLITQHGSQPVLARLPVVHAVDPPLLLDLEVALEVQQQVGGRHGAAGEEVLGHPAAVEVVGGGLVCEDVHEEFPARDEGARDFGEEELVVFGVFCRLN